MVNNVYIPKNDGVDHINIYTKGKTQLGVMLSNLAMIPVKVNDDIHTNLKLSCMEAYWYLKKLESGYKVGEIPEYETWLDVRDYLKAIEGANSFTVKKIGKEFVDAAIGKYGIGYDCFVPNDYFKKCIVNAIEAKIVNNKQLLDLVLANDLPYVHYYYYGENNPKIIPDKHEWQTAGINEICSRLKSEKANTIKSIYDYEAAVLLANIWSKAYYTHDKPLASDEEYDNLVRRIKIYENANPDKILASSPTQRVGDVIKKGFEKAKHNARMWSMEDIFTKDELTRWLDRLKYYGEIGFVCEPKYDGLSLNLQYEKGELVKAITRGDGEVGENVINNITYIDGIPLFISDKVTIEVRGEVVMDKEAFEKLNTSREQNGLPIFANPRNAAAGSLRQQDPTELKGRGLVFVPWGIGQTKLKFVSYCEILAYINNLGFKPYHNGYMVSANTIEDIIKQYEKLIEDRDEIKFTLDGMVIKVDPISVQTELGYTNKYPKWMVAYKFPAMEKTTKLLNVEFQVGRTGVVTPVGKIAPVILEGALVSNVTLHNFEEIRRKDLKLGDNIIVIRSGDVIPKLTTNLTDRRTGEEKDIVLPTHCPICDTELVSLDIITKCPNELCSSRVINSLIHFVSRKAMNIVGLSEQTLTKLYNDGVVKSISDIYRLEEDKLKASLGLQHKRIANLLKAIEDSKTVKLNRFIFALGIETIGEVAANKIASRYGDNWLSISKEELNSLDGFGEELCNNYINFIINNRNAIENLASLLNIVKDVKVIKDSVFTGKTVVLTGSMFKPRDEVKELFEKHGAKISNSVSKNTDYLIYGEDAGTKLAIAEKLGINCININDAIVSLEI